MADSDLTYKPTKVYEPEGKHPRSKYARAGIAGLALCICSLLGALGSSKLADSYSKRTEIYGELTNPEYSEELRNQYATLEQRAKNWSETLFWTALLGLGVAGGAVISYHQDKKSLTNKAQ